MTRYFRWSFEQALPAYDGLDTDTAPYAVSKTRAPVVQNFLTDRPGALVMRGPLTQGFNINAGQRNWVGSLVIDTQIVLGRRAPSATATREPWVTPYRLPLADTELATGNVSADLLNLSTGIIGPPSGLSALAVPVPAGGATLPAGTYYWTITALTGSGETIGSNEVTLIMPGNRAAKLTWPAFPGAWAYRVYRSTVSGGETTSPAFITLALGTSYTDDTTTPHAGAAPTVGTAHSIAIDTMTNTRDLIPRGRPVRIGAGAYAVGYDSAGAVIAHNNFHHVSTKIVQALPGASIGAAPVLAAITNGPYASQDVCAHLERLWVLGGTVPGANGAPPLNMNTLYWTDPANSNYQTGSLVWADAVTGLTNQIVVDSDDQNDFGVALAKVGQNMAVFKRTSLHLLTGSSSATFRVIPASNDHGCLDPRSVCEYEQGVFFMSHDGLMWYDGHQLKNVSPNLRSSLIAAVLSRVGDTSPDGGFVRVIRLPNNYIMVSVGWVDPAALLPSVTDFCGLYHPTRGTWSTFSSGVMANPPVFMFNAQRPYISDGQNLFQADLISLPESAGDGQRGYDTHPNGTTQSRIPCLWKSRILPLGSPVSHASVHRFWLDYAFRLTGATDSTTGGGWNVQVLGSDGTSITDQTGASVQVNAMGDPLNGGSTSFPYKRQLTIKSFREAMDAQLQISYADDGSNTFPAVKQADIYDGGFEFYPSHQQDSE